MARSKIVEQWLYKSNRDLRFAKASLDLQEKFYEQIVFHCQQSVEKAVKGFLAHNKKSFTKTHDIGELLILVNDLDRVLSKLLESTKILTKYAVTIRYPETGDEDLIIDENITKHCIALADATLIEISARIN